MEKKSFLFWQRWLVYSSWLFACASVMFALFGGTWLFAPYNTMLSEIFWNRPDFLPAAEAFRTFIYAPLGGTVACCYILLAYIAKYPFKEKQVWARNAIVLAFSVWVVLDSAACLYFGVYGQVYIINAFSILVKALPLIFTWKEFGLKRV